MSSSYVLDNFYFLGLSIEGVFWQIKKLQFGSTFRTTVNKNTKLYQINCHTNSKVQRFSLLSLQIISSLSLTIRNICIQKRKYLFSLKEPIFEKLNVGMFSENNVFLVVTNKLILFQFDII